MNYSSVTSIVPKMIGGIFLILAWFPAIIFNELNNKGNIDELNDLVKNSIKYITTLTKVDLPDSNRPTDAILNASTTHSDLLSKFSLSTHYYLTWNKTTQTTTKDTKGNDVKTTSTMPDELYKGPFGDLDVNNYKYLLKNSQSIPINKTFVDGTTTYNNYVLHVIPQGTDIVKVSYDSKIIIDDVTYYNYEFGTPGDETKTTIVNLLTERKKTGNFLSRWVFRIIIFIMLALGLGLLVAPLQAVADISGQIPYLGGLLAFPVRIILSLYYSIGIASALLLTVILTFLVWGLINHPLIAGISTGGLIGLIYMFKHK